MKAPMNVQETNAIVVQNVAKKLGNTEVLKGELVLPTDASGNSVVLNLFG
jgi:hypothetical protein